jgi:Tfp pilus assembly protein PilF
MDNNKKSVSQEIPKQEIRRQLARIIQSPAFQGAEQSRKAKVLGPLLEFLVNEMLEGRTPSEQDILVDFFKRVNRPNAEDDPIVRSNVFNLRRRLGDHYALYGADDLVQLDIPKGQYGVLASYNQRSPVNKEVRLGLYHVNREDPNHTKQALAHFEKAIYLEPTYSEAHAGKATALVTMTLHSYMDSPEKAFADAMIAASRALELDSKSWSAQMSIAAISLFRHDWEKADEEYGKARAMNPVGITDEGGYGPFLVSRGHYEEALKLANSYLNEYPDDVIFLRRAALYFYALRHYSEADAISKNILRMDEHLWLGHIMLAFNCLAQNEATKALEHMRRVEPLTGMTLWPGLLILCLAAAGEMPEASKRFEELKAESARRYIQPMQLALGYMAMGDPLTAIQFWGKACEECDPFTAWLHLWPFLDPLRAYPEFRALLERWKFPPGM